MFLAVGFLFFVPGICEAQETKESKSARKLLNAEKFPENWIFYSAEKDSKLSDTWKMETSASDQSPVLICGGEPFGYLRTEKEYENFEFSLEWKYTSDPNGNSGILIYTCEDDKIWPKSIQIQLHGPTTGSIFPSGGAKSDNTLDLKNMARPLNKWNKCVVTSRDGKLSLVINGKKVGEVTGCVPKRGAIALQSEGAEIHFRNIWLRELD